MVHGDIGMIEHLLDRLASLLALMQKDERSAGQNAFSLEWSCKTRIPKRARRSTSGTCR